MKAGPITIAVEITADTSRLSEAVESVRSILHSPDLATVAVLSAVRDERRRQVDRWGEQSLPHGTGEPHHADSRDRFRAVCEAHAEDGTVTWTDVLLEEVFEALAEADPARLRAELVQAAAVCVAWVEAIDREGRQG